MQFTLPYALSSVSILGCVLYLYFIWKWFPLLGGADTKQYTQQACLFTLLQTCD